MNSCVDYKNEVERFDSLPWKERGEDLIKRNPRYRELEKRLLALGGNRMIIQPYLYMDSVLMQGQEWPTDKLVMRRGEPCDCHANTAKLWFVNRPKGFQMTSGWALREDGGWNQHSWGWQNGHIIETTVRRSKYFGFGLTEFDAHMTFHTEVLYKDLQLTMRFVEHTQTVRDLLGFAVRGIPDRVLDDRRLQFHESLFAQFRVAAGLEATCAAN